MIYVKQSTSVTLLIGPFLDSTDGNTAETGLTISQADVRLSKNGGNMAQKNESTACTHDELGYYTCPLDATDTNTLGILKIMVHETGALPVWMEAEVLTANVFDTMYSTDQLDVNVTNVAGTAQTGNDNGADINAILADTDELQSNQGNWLTATGFATAAALTTHDGKLDTVDGIVDAILEDTGTTLPAEHGLLATEAKQDVIDGIVDDILTDTGTTIPATLTDMAGATFATGTDSLEAIRNRGDAAWVTGSGGDATEAKQDTLLANLATVDGIVDSILVDTGTTLPASIAALNDITVADIIAGVAEGSLDLQAILRIILSAVAGKTTTNGTRFRDVADSKDRIVAVTDASKNRTSMTLDGS
ncbi:MAG: hypothetical protein DRN81_03160 [Thermoproteota archaeon]|nr:MAG: hypothetical protein DRN81_03160 [Candidatus Korarchaeota archaeon]